MAEAQQPSRPLTKVRTLYHSPLCPFSRKIRFLLHEKKLPFELVEEPFWEYSQEFTALNPASEVPVLVESEECILIGNYAVTEYLESAYPESSFIGTNEREKAEVRRLMDWFDAKFNREVTMNIVFEKVFKQLLGYGVPHSEAIRAGLQNILYHLDYIGFLTEGRNWLAGERMTLADITAAAHLSCIDYLGNVPWHHNPQAREWYALVKSHPGFRPLLSDQIKGHYPPRHYADLDF